MAIEDLITAVPPPAKPIETGDQKNWVLIEQTLGISLPTDFRDFGLRYGTGRFTDRRELHIGVFNPFSSVFLEKIRGECDRCRECKEVLGQESIPYPIFPETSGLLPWGGDEIGSGMYWLTEGPAKEWPVILMNHHEEIERYDLSMTTFLAKVFRREFRCILWPEPFFLEPVIFEPTKQLHRIVLE